MNYNTDDRKIEGQVLYYKPYPAEMRKQKPHPISITLRVILILVVLAATIALAIAGKAEGLAGRWEIDEIGEINLTAEADEEFRWLGGMTPLQWEAAAAELPEVLKMFGLEAGRR